MSGEQEQFLNLRVLPARLDKNQTAWFLGFEIHDMSTLVSKGLLKPLGNPVLCGPKYFATSELRKLAENRLWLDRASVAITQNWKKKNQKRARCFQKTDIVEPAQNSEAVATTPSLQTNELLVSR